MNTIQPLLPITRLNNQNDTNMIVQQQIYTYTKKQK